MAYIHRAERDVLEELHSNAVGHAELSDGLFVIDKFNPKQLPDYMSLRPKGDTENRRAIGNRLSHTALEIFAEVIDSRYKTMDRTISDPDHVTAFSIMGELLRKKYNVGLTQSHGEAIDTAFDLGYKSVRLAEQGVEHDTSLILSKGFDFLKIDTKQFNVDPGTIRETLKNIGITLSEDGTIPLRSFLGIVADKTHFVIPSSSTFEEMIEKNRKLIGDFNSSSISLLIDDLTDDSTRGTLLGSALTGTTSKQLDTNEYRRLIKDNRTLFNTIPEKPKINETEDVRVVGDISDGVIKYLEYCFSFASGIVLDTEDSRQDIRPSFTVATETSDIPRLGVRLTESLEVLHPGALFIQDIGRTLPTKASEPISSE